MLLMLKIRTLPWSSAITPRMLPRRGVPTRWSIHFTCIKVLLVMASSSNITVASWMRTWWSWICVCGLVLSYHWGSSHPCEVALLIWNLLSYLLLSLYLHYCRVGLFKIFYQTAFVINLNRHCCYLRWRRCSFLRCSRIYPSLSNLSVYFRASLLCIWNLLL